MRRLIFLIVATVAMGLMSATAASAEGGGEEPSPPAEKIYCGGDGASYSTSNLTGFLDSAAGQGGFWVYDSKDNFTVVLPYTGPLNLQYIMVDSPSTIGSLDKSTLGGVAGVWMPVSAGACSAKAPPPRPQQIAVCSPVVVDRPGDIPGRFLAVEYPAWVNPDGPYHSMPPANFVEGVGLTCDNPPAGFVRKGTAGDTQHVSSEPGYPLWVKG